MENLMIINESHRKNLIFSNVNLVFGHSGSGKTTFLEELDDIFSGKDKNWLYNGSKIVSSDFNVIHITGSENINSHLKLSSKSLLSKFLLKGNYSETFQEACRSLSNTLEYTRKEIETSLTDILNDARVTIKCIDDPLDFLLNNINISCSDISSSDEKKSLLKLISSLTKLGNTKTIVLIDDFTSDLDEENVASFLDDISNLNAYFILTSNKTIPQYILNNKINIFSIRNNNIIKFQELDKLLLDAIDGQPDYLSFEDYMLGRGYNDISGISKSYLDIINKDINSNFLRILTARNPVINDTYIPGKVTIIPKSEKERKIYEYVISLLELSNNN